MKANQFLISQTKKKSLMWNIIIDAAFGMILCYMLLNVGGFMSGTVANQVSSNLKVAAGGHAPTVGDKIINDTKQMIGNSTGGFASNTNMVNIAITIGIIITPISMLLVWRRIQ